MKTTQKIDTDTGDINITSLVTEITLSIIYKVINLSVQRYQTTQMKWTLFKRL